MVRKQKKWHFGITNPVTGSRVYIGPFATKDEARKEMAKRHGIRKYLAKR